MAALVQDIQRRRRPTHDIPVQPMRTTVVTQPAAAAAQTKTQPSGMKIIQKVNVGQTTKVKKRKTSPPIVAKRKMYNKIKRELIAAFKKAKKKHYTLGNSKIKKMPVKERKEARRKLKQELQARLVELQKKLPSASKLTRAAIEKLISAARLLKW